MKAEIALYNPQQAHQALAQVWAHLKAELIAGNRHTLAVKPVTRSVEQNALLHALLQEIANTREWAGKKRDVECWKRLLTAAWLRARGESVELLPALDGHGVDVVFRPTHKLTVAECSELVEFVQAWIAETEE